MLDNSQKIKTGFFIKFFVFLKKNVYIISTELLDKYENM